MRSFSLRSVLRAGIFCSLCLLPILAGGRQQNSPVTLRMKFPLGASHKFRTVAKLVATVSSPSLPQAHTQTSTFDSIERDKVTRLLPDGGGEVTSVTLSEKDTDDGKPVPAKPDKKPEVTDYSARGEILSRKGMTPADVHTELLTGGNAFLAMLLTSWTLPKQAIGPGDTWTQTVHLPDMPGIGSATIQSRFVRIEQIGAYRTALIHAEVKIPLSLMLDQNGKQTQAADQAVSTGTGTATGTFDHYFAINQGFTVRLKGEGTIDNTFRVQMQPGAAPVEGNTKIKTTLSYELAP